VYYSVITVKVVQSGGLFWLVTLLQECVGEKATSYSACEIQLEGFDFD
jgi:hypothetical protein